MIRHLLFTGLLLTVAGSVLAQMPERLYVYKVERITADQAPQLDGKLDEKVWQNRPQITAFRLFLGTPGMPTQPSEVTLITDGTKLYIAEKFYDDDMANVLFNPARDPFWNDCTELYFDPRHDLSRSIQLVVDCGGRRWWQKQNDDGWGWYADSNFGVLADWEAAAFRGPDYWSLEIAINATSFEFTCTPGEVTRFNVCRFRLNPKKSEFSAWTYGPAGRQKDMSAWGHLIFLGPGQSGASDITEADIKLIYPDLGSRVVEVPVSGGFVTYTRADTQKQTFVELLTPPLKQSEQYLGDAEETIAKLPTTARGLEALKAEVAKLKASLEGNQALVAQELTLAQYDQLREAVETLRKSSETVYWRAQILALI
jgi:hypothetical protein